MSVLRLFLTVTFLVNLASAGWTQTYNLSFGAAELNGSLGGTVTAAVVLDNDPDPVTGFSFGIRHDAAALAFERAVPGSAVSRALSSDQIDERFFAVEADPAGGPGVTVAMIVTPQGSEGAGGAIPPGAAQEVMRITYTVIAEAAGSTSLTFAGDLGSPEVPVLLDLGGVAQAPTNPDVGGEATVTLTEGALNFVRGDVNQSGRLDLLDGIVTLRFLFMDGEGVPPSGQATIANCLVVLNTDGSTVLDTADVEDERDIEVTDAIFLFNALFASGAPPPAPFPDCGEAAAAASGRMACVEFPCS